MRSSIAFLLLATTSFLLLFASCARKSAPAPEEPPSRGERDRLMSELHASRKTLLDALAAANESKLKEAPDEGHPSPSEAVEALIIRERNLLTLMGASSLSTEATPAEPAGLSAEERQARAAEQEQKVRSVIDGCLPKLREDGLRVLPNPSNLDSANLTQGFRAARDANIVFVRETNYSLDRRLLKDDVCGEINLATALMLESALTDEVAEMVKAAK
ncbi:MAG: hypothetical protein LC114_08035 [Bryobacterales bacterium]|nr:hypothetical protein [Bryobacterales bacterium]